MTPHPPKPILVWITPSGPNPWKPIFILEELGLNYEIKCFAFEGVKRKPFIDVNPNGRVPAIQDPNTDLTLWESGAILTYLISQYDTQNKLSYATMKEKHLCDQYLHFQTSGQGPYFGQAGVFRFLHPEKLPSAITRFENEIQRVLGVLDGILAAKPADAQWLVGNKMTFADMAFVPWNGRLPDVTQKSYEEIWAGVPHARAWHERMAELPSWKKCLQLREYYLNANNLQWNGIPKGIETFTEYEAQIAAEDAKRKE
ncbi:glutathione S-transferase [Xylariaceae sp. FL1651]|nr:glutathione S-transferase [Xylariaceae sp. FL1651]